MECFRDFITEARPDLSSTTGHRNPSGSWRTRSRGSRAHPAELARVGRAGWHKSTRIFGWNASPRLTWPTSKVCSTRRSVRPLLNESAMSAPLAHSAAGRRLRLAVDRREQVRLLLWEWVWLMLCAWTPKPLNLGGCSCCACSGRGCTGTPFVHQRARIQIPWKLTMHDRACLGDRANAYSLGEIEIGARATVAQEVYLCAGTHDFLDRRPAAANGRRARRRGRVHRRARVRPAGGDNRRARGRRRGVGGHARRAAGRVCRRQSRAACCVPRLSVLPISP